MIKVNLKNALYFLVFVFNLTCLTHRRFVLTGGPGVGKSSVIEELKKRGYQIASEAFTELYKQSEQQGMLKELFSDPIELKKNLLDKQIDIEGKLNNKKLAFLDRSMWDVIFFGNYFNVKMPGELTKKASSRKYDLIFALDPLPEKYYKQTDIRKESAQEALKIHNMLKSEYKHRGFKIIDVPFDTPSKRADFIIDKIAHDYFSIEEIIDCFAGNNSLYVIEDYLDPIKLIEFSKDKRLYRFFGVEKDKQQEVNFKEFKNRLSKVMRASKENMMQLIGDSNRFSEQGTQFARKFLSKHFNGNNIIEYGYTGAISSTQLDVNSFVNELADQNPSQSRRILANIVGHTHTAISQWGSYASPNVRKFVVVYNKFGMTEEPKYESGIKVSGHTTFGDDVIISDFLLQAKDGDYVICLEGGPQSFLQCVNSLEHSLKIEFVYNLRTPENNKFFSTAIFFKRIKDALELNKNLSRKEVKDIFDKYLSTLNSPWDPKRHDSKTKKELFERALNRLIDQDIYQKITNLCKFWDGGA